MHKSHLKLLKLVQTERNTLTEILTHLKVVSKNKVYIKMGYSNMLQYCVKELKYSESAAYRRLATLKLEKRIPNIKKSIKDGSLSLSNATNINKSLNEKEKEIKKRVEINGDDLLNKIKDMPSRQADKIIREEIDLKPKKRVIKIEVDEESYQKWLDYKARQVDKKKTDEELLMTAIEDKNVEPRAYRKAAPTESSNPRYISAENKRAVRKRAKNSCHYPGCNSKYGLEIDHIHPVSAGGKGNLENLQLLCREHNQFKGNSILT